METILLPAATIFFLLSFGHTLFALGAGRVRPGRLNLVAMLAGFLLLSLDLWHRGRLQGACPIHSLFDVLVFMSWSTVLLYLLVGPAFRLSLLGAFASPLVFLLLLVAQIAPIGRVVSVRVKPDPWIEFHASVSLVAYGAFALASVASLMYLAQDRQLKRRQGGTLLYNLPPITDLAVANVRLLELGFGLLTVSVAIGFVSGMEVNTVKFFVSMAIWGLYAAVVVLRRLHSLPPRMAAVLSVAVFSVALVALPSIQYFSTSK